MHGTSITGVDSFGEYDDHRYDDPPNGTLSTIEVGKNSASEPPRLIAVQVKNACKSYKAGTPILNHLYMTVPRGTM